MVIIIFYFDICIKFTISTNSQSQRGRNNNISLVVCFLYYENVKTFMLELFNNSRETLAKHVA